MLSTLKGKLQNYEKKTGHTYVQWMVAMLAATCLVNYSIQGGWISPMAKLLQSDLSPSGVPLSNAEISWVASTLSIAAIFGVPLYIYISDTYGRKISLIAMAAPQALCWIIKLSSANTTALIIARICAGVPAGGCFILIPMYIKEISQDNIRGTLVSSSILYQNIGLMAIYAMGSYVDYYVILWIALSIPVVSIFFMIFAPESPAFLVKKEKFEDAAKTIARLRGLEIDDSIIQSEIELMKQEEIHFKTVEKITFIKIFKNKAWCRAFILGLLLLSTLDLNGYFTIFTYAVTILTESGVTINPELQTLSIPAIMIMGSLVAMICVEKLGRKPLLVGAFVISILSIGCLATVMLAQHYGVEVPGWLPLMALIMFVWAYAAGISPVTYVVLSEIYNFQVRAKLIGCLVAFGWFLSFVQLAAYGLISSFFGVYTMFYIFTFINVIGMFVCLTLLPETKGKSVDEIEQLLLGKNSTKI